MIPPINLRINSSDNFKLDGVSVIIRALIMEFECRVLSRSNEKLELEAWT